ncbi:MAG: nucleoside deaminase [Deltaproteobacteria bacterium]|nr:nucleoside deaminase [Deltaproteobacteria bacterium]
MDDIVHMECALAEAEKAARRGEVPVGAVLVLDGLAVCAGNAVIEHNDPTAHAEILAMRAAASQVGNYRLTGATLYCTIEPCIMCMAAAVHARVGRVVYGAADDKWGGAKSLYALGADPRLNHAIEVEGGVLEDRCRAIIQEFFQNRRREAEKSR